MNFYGSIIDFPDVNKYIINKITKLVKKMNHTKKSYL